MFALQHTSKNCCCVINGHNKRCCLLRLVNAVDDGGDDDGLSRGVAFPEGDQCSQLKV